jgi:hypothetical protein
MSHLVKGLRFAALMLLCLPLTQVTRGAAQQAWATVRCESNGSYARCPAYGTWRGARLVQHRITCGTTLGQQVTCRTNGYATGVRLVRDLSGGRCRQGQTWGHTDAFIWANRGCRAEFSISYGGGAVGGGPGGGVGDQLSHRARRACESKVLSTGHGSVRVDNTYQRDENVIVNARATDAGRDWNIECTYRTVLQSAVLTRVSEVGGVLQSGPGKRQSWGVQHQLGLRRAGQTYSRATCNYLSSEGRVTLAS